jgi:uncharacterized membrane protein
MSTDPRARRSGAGVAALALLGALAALTLLGIAVNWPHHRGVSIAGTAHRPPTVAATVVGVRVTLTLAEIFTRVAHLSGATSDAALYAQAFGQVSLRGLLLASIVIGALGVLGDTTVTQASTVIALRRANPALDFRGLVTHATSVGHDHIAATVNTLVLAYTGAAIPVLIVFSLSGTSPGTATNTEAVAEAIVATLVGSIGLMLAVPVTTALAAWLVHGAVPAEPDGIGVTADAAHSHARHL